MHHIDVTKESISNEHDIFVIHADHLIASAGNDLTGQYYGGLFLSIGKIIQRINHISCINLVRLSRRSVTPVSLFTMSEWSMMCPLS